MAVSVVAIFDIGKTNKKYFLFDNQYSIVHEESTTIDECLDLDGYPSEDLYALCSWINDRLDSTFANKKYRVEAINFSCYGASLVHLDHNYKIALPLTNYLKPFNDRLSKDFNNLYNTSNRLLVETASPYLGNLNSGLQLFDLKHSRPQIYNKIKVSLHLPQFLAFTLCGAIFSDMTSIGCHTLLWDFQKNTYHQWVQRENIDKKLAPIALEINTYQFNDLSLPLKVGIGLHDSSSALIPYLINFHEPFILISTGTWSISLNPFNQSVLSLNELNHDCLSYLSSSGQKVKASRKLIGLEHEHEVKKLCTHFHKQIDFYKEIRYNPLFRTDKSTSYGSDLSAFSSYEEAYHKLIQKLVDDQITSTNLIIEKNKPLPRIFVDGGFSKNSVFMTFLASAYNNTEVFAASMAQASALGAALSIHKFWNNLPIPQDIINLRYYSGDIPIKK